MGAITPNERAISVGLTAKDFPFFSFFFEETGGPIEMSITTSAHVCGQRVTIILYFEKMLKLVVNKRKVKEIPEQANVDELAK